MRSAREPPPNGHTTPAEPESPARYVLPLEGELAGRLAWLATLRWLAASLATFIGLCCIVVDVGLPGRAIAVVGLSIAAYNVGLLLARPRLKSSVVDANIQIGLDWVALVLLLHLTGGLHSPALLFFIFHVILAAILIPGLGCYVHAFIATAVIGSVGYMESTAVLSHVRPIWADLAPPGEYYLLVLAGSVGASMFLSAYLVSTIAGHLRQTEQEQIDLQRELGDAVERLDVANKDLIALDEEKSLYTRTVTHQLRSPLAAIQSMLRVLLDGYTGALDAKVVDVIDRAEKRTMKLIETVGDMLRLAELAFQRHPPAGQRVALEPIVTGLVARHEPTAASRKVAIEAVVPEELAVVADPDDIEDALDNLLSNAVKYSLPGGNVSVRGWLERGDVRISVEDAGIGIPRDAQDDLFQEFYRSPNAKLFEPTGTGLGLVIAKRSVERWGGTISVASDLGEGATFSIAFAAAR